MSSDSDKPKAEQYLSHVTGKCASSCSPELADANKKEIVTQAIDNCSSEDEIDDALSIASEDPNLRQGNLAPHGVFLPNLRNDNGNPIV